MARKKSEVKSNDLDPTATSANSKKKADEKLSRRKLLAKGVAAAAAVAGTVAANSLPRIAEAADGDPIKIGQTNTATSTTILSGNGVNPLLRLETNVPTVDIIGSVLRVKNTSTSEYGGGIDATAPNGVAISGSSITGKGVSGGAWIGGVGVEGIASTGVRGCSGNPGDPGYEGEIGVEGVIARQSKQTGPNAGVIGRVHTNPDDFVSGPPSDKGVGVMGFSGIESSQGPDGTGVRGVGSAIGVCAESSSGKAVDVHGKAYFSTAGSGVISCGRRTKIVTGATLDENALILVTLQGSGGPNVHVEYARKLSADSFKVVLNKKTKNDTPFAWFVVN